MGTIDIIDIKPLNEIKDPTWGTGVMHKRLVLVGIKMSGAITEEEAHALKAKAWPEETDGGAIVMTATAKNGAGLLLVFDAYVVEQLSILKRLRHTLRMFKAAITRNVGVGSCVRVIVLK